VIGASGSGESSLARLLVGLWRPLKGSIRLDGATLDQWPAEALARHIGYMPQAIDLLDGTIAENIASFDRQASSEKIIAAARAARIHDLVVSLPDGYSTLVGETGRQLSAGQKQRIALARALYGEPAWPSSSPIVQARFWPWTRCSCSLTDGSRPSAPRRKYSPRCCVRSVVRQAPSRSCRPRKQERSEYG